MEGLVVGDVVVVNFPFSDLSQQKRRPALVVAVAEYGDLILCQITSKAYASKRAVKLDHPDFTAGALPVQSYIRPDKLMTVDPAVVVRKAGVITPSLSGTVLSRIRALFSDGNNDGQ